MIVLLYDSGKQVRFLYEHVAVRQPGDLAGLFAFSNHNRPTSRHKLGNVIGEF